MVRLLLATGQRRSEVGEMEWRELDDERNVWLIPRERMKAKRAHVVPLSPLALSILAEQQPKLGAHVFASTRSASRGGTIPISGWSKYKARLDRAATEALRQLAGDAQQTIPDWCLHDLRRTTVTLMTESGVSRFIAARVLGHAERDVTGQHYDLYSYLPEKKQALDLWAARLAAIVEDRAGPDNVVALDAARGLRTIDETAEVLNVSPRTVRRLVAADALRVHRFGRLVRVSDDDIAVFLAASRGP